VCGVSVGVTALEFLRDVCHQKKAMGYIIPSCVRDSTFSRFGTVRACDRQTDGRTRGRTHGPTHDDSIYLASIASRGINLMTEIFLLRPWT